MNKKKVVEVEKPEIVRTVAIDVKYRDRTFFAVSPWDGKSGKYLTGQQDDLDLVDMTGERKISKEMEKKHPIIIDPLDGSYPVIHNKEYDITDRRKEIMIDMFKLCLEIAVNKKAAVKGMHLFYLENREQQATDDVKEFNQTLEAGNLVKESAMKQLIDKGLLLYGPGVMNLTHSQITAKLQATCKSEPDLIIKAYDKESLNKLFVLKLEHFKILDKRQGKYYDNETLVGRDLQDAVDYTIDSKNSDIVSRWADALNTKEPG